MKDTRKNREEIEEQVLIGNAIMEALEIECKQSNNRKGPKHESYSYTL